METKTIMRWIGIGVGAIVLVCLLFSSIYTVAPGHKGVMKVFNQVQDEPVSSGWGFKVPIFADVEEMSVQTQLYRDSMDAYTQDMQNVKIQYSINYELQPTKVSKLYENVGLDYEATLIPGRFLDLAKSEFGDWKAQAIISDRTKVGEMIQKAFREKLKNECNYFQNVVVQLTDLQFSPEYDKTNEDKEIQLQKAQTAENVTRRVQEEAKQKVIAAEAEAKAMQIRADALAKNPALTQYEATLKWDGKLPQYMMGGGSIPMIQLPAGK